MCWTQRPILSEDQRPLPSKLYKCDVSCSVGYWSLYLPHTPSYPTCPEWPLLLKNVSPEWIFHLIPVEPGKNFYCLTRFRLIHVRLGEASSSPCAVALEPCSQPTWLLFTPCSDLPTASVLWKSLSSSFLGDNYSGHTILNWQLLCFTSGYPRGLPSVLLVLWLMSKLAGCWL